MRWQWWLFAAVVVTGSLSACGGSSPKPLGINAYTVRGHEEPGYPTERLADYKTVSALETARGSFGGRRLTAEGFKEAAFADTGSSQPGLSFVIELGSAAAAQRELLAQTGQDLRTPHAVKFSDGAIPSAIGVAYPRPSGGAGNVLFVEGRCLILVGDEDNGTSAYRQPAIAGANAIWKRTHSRKGACST